MPFISVDKFECMICQVGNTQVIEVNMGELLVF